MIAIKVDEHLKDDFKEKTLAYFESQKKKPQKPINRQFGFHFLNIRKLITPLVNIKGKIQEGFVKHYSDNGRGIELPSYAELFPPGSVFHKK